MKKLSFAMALIMILAVCASMFGVTASADYADNTVAVLSDGTNSTEYASLADAFAAYRGGETLTIVKDITLTEPITVEGTILGDDMTTLVAKDTLTIEGNDKTISSTVEEGIYALTFSDADVVINDLTIKSNYHGIKATGQSSLVLNDSNVLAGNTSIDTHITADHENQGTAIIQDNNNKGYVEINNGVIKGAGKRTSEQVEKEGEMTTKYTYTSGTIVDVRYGRVVLNNPTVVGYYSDALVQVGDASGVDTSGGPEALTAAGWINDGTYVLYNADMSKSNSVCVRSYRYALLTIFDGDFIVYNKSNSNGASVIGSHSAGYTYTYVLGGRFYNLSSRNTSVLIGHNAANNSVSSMESAMFIYMYGGEFYSSIVDGRVEHNLDGETAVIRNKADYTLAKTEGATITDPYANGLIVDVNSWKYTYKYNATTAKEGAKIKVQNGDDVYYADTLWQAINALADDGATVTLLDNITLTQECVLLARNADITIDLNGKTITAGTDVINALRCQMGNITIQNGTIVNNGGDTLNFGYSPIDFGGGEFEEVKYANFKVNVTLNNVTLTASEDAYETKCVCAGTLKFEGTCSINGAAPEAATVDIAGMPSVGGAGSGSVDTGSTDEEPEDDKKDDAPAETPADDDNTTEEKKGCNNSIGVGAVAVLAVAGLACGIVSKKRED